MKILPVGAGLFHADGQTDMTKLIVVFRNFANALRNEGGRGRRKGWDKYKSTQNEMEELKKK